MAAISGPSRSGISGVVCSAIAVQTVSTERCGEPLVEQELACVVGPVDLEPLLLVGVGRREAGVVVERSEVEQFRIRLQAARLGVDRPEEEHSPGVVEDQLARHSPDRPSRLHGRCRLRNLHPRDDLGHEDSTSLLLADTKAVAIQVAYAVVRHAGRSSGHGKNDRPCRSIARNGGFSNPHRPCPHTEMRVVQEASSNRR